MLLANLIGQFKLVIAQVLRFEIFGKDRHVQLPQFSGVLRQQFLKLSLSRLLASRKWFLVMQL